MQRQMTITFRYPSTSPLHLNLPSPSLGLQTHLDRITPSTTRGLSDDGLRQRIWGFGFNPKFGASDYTLKPLIRNLNPRSQTDYLNPKPLIRNLNPQSQTGFRTYLPGARELA